MPHDLAPRAELCLRRGWQWLVRNLLLFLPSDPADPENLKQMGELALLYAKTNQWSQTDRDGEVEQVGTFLLDFFSRPEIVQLARKRPAHYSAYVLPYLALRSVGRRIDAYEDALVRLDRSGYPYVGERVPYRGVELLHSRWKAGLSRDGPRSYRGTALKLCRNPAYLLKWEVYSITHTMFYLADFNGPIPWMSSQENYKIGRLIETLLVHYWRIVDWDLVGELLLNLIALDRTNDILFGLCAGDYFQAWRPDGVLPGPTFVQGHESATENYTFTHCYHTTLVGLLLCSGYLHRIHPSLQGSRNGAC